MTYPIFVFKKSAFYVLLNPISICFKNELNNNLMSQPQFIYDSTGKITGYKTPGGADTVFPFSNMLESQSSQKIYRQSIAVEKDRYYALAYFDVNTGNTDLRYPSINGAIISGAEQYHLIHSYNTGNSYKIYMGVCVIKTDSTTLTIANVYPAVLLQIT